MTGVIDFGTVAEAMTVVIGGGYDGEQNTRDSARRRIDETGGYDVVTKYGDAHSIR
jgi:hypothetical protein